MRVNWELLFKSYSCQTRRCLLYRSAIDLVGQVLQFTVLAFDCKFVSRGFYDWLNWGQRHSLVVVPVEPVFGWLCHHTHDDFPALFRPVLWARSLYTHQCLLPVEKAFPSTLAGYFTCKDWLWRVAQGWSLDKHLSHKHTSRESPERDDASPVPQLCKYDNSWKLGVLVPPLLRKTFKNDLVGMAAYEFSPSMTRFKSRCAVLKSLNA